MLVVVPLLPKTFRVSSESDTSLAVELDYGYTLARAQCSQFILTTSPTSSTRTVLCNVTNTRLDNLKSNVHYTVTVTTSAKYSGHSHKSIRPKTATAWTCEFYS